MIGMNREPYVVPSNAPVVVHRHGEGSRRRSIAVIVDELTGDADPAEVLAAWRERIGCWVSRADAAAQLGVSIKRVDQLRAEGRLQSRSIGGVVAIDAESLSAELRQREETAGE